MNTFNVKKPISPKKPKIQTSPKKRNNLTTKKSGITYKPSLTPTRRNKNKEILSLTSMSINTTLTNDRPKTPDRIKKQNFNNTTISTKRNVLDLSDLILCKECNKITKFSIFTWCGRSNEYYISCEECHKQGKCENIHQNLNSFIHYGSSEFEKSYRNSTNNICNKSDKHKNNNIKADYFCIECQKWMCNDCYNIHNKSADTKEHTIANKEICSSVLCKEHNNLFEFYCNTCKIHGCKLCPEKHINHINKLVPLKNILNKTQIDLIKDNIKKAKDYIDDYNKKIYENMNMLLINKIRMLEKSYKQDQYYYLIVLSLYLG